MDFKQAYKNANNSIHADRALIDKIYTKAQKSHRTKTFRFPAYCGIAAAAAVFVLVFNAVNVNDKEITKSHTYVASKDIMSKETGTAILPEKNTETQFTADLVAEKEKISTATETYNQRAEISTKEVLPDTKPAETVTEPVQTNLDKIDTAQDDAYSGLTSEEAVSGGGGGSGSAAAVAEYSVAMASLADEESAEKENTFENMTAQQYYDYIGNNVIAVAKIPADMEFEPFDGTEISKDENGNIVADTGVFMAYNPQKEKSISIEVTKIPPKAKMAANEAASENLHTIKVVTDNCTYTITAFNITEEEIDELVASLQQ